MVIRVAASVTKWQRMLLRRHPFDEEQNTRERRENMTLSRHVHLVKIQKSAGVMGLASRSSILANDAENLADQAEKR
jgi:hypothetical protein